MNVVLVRATFMLHHGHFTAETSWTSLMTTYVWPLPSVDTTMTGESRWIRESFFASYMQAFVWSIAGMSPNVSSESTLLIKSLTAPVSDTRVWSLIGVYTVMSFEVGPTVKALRRHINRPPYPTKIVLIPCCKFPNYRERTLHSVHFPLVLRYPFCNCFFALCTN